MRSARLLAPLLVAVVVAAPATGHQGDDPSLGDPGSLIHACQRTGASGRVRIRFVSPTGTCPSNPAWQPVHWSKVPPSVVVRDISARVFNSTNVTLLHNTSVALPFNTERWDTDSIHDTAVDPSRLTARTSGKYLIFGNVKFTGNSSGTRELLIRLNGTTTIAEERVTANILEPGANGNVMSLATHYDLAANEYVELLATQTSGTTVVAFADPETSPEFGMVKLP